MTEAPGMIADDDIDALRETGWDEDGIYEATALISFFNFTGCMEAVSGLPSTTVPDAGRMAEARSDERT